MVQLLNNLVANGFQRDFNRISSHAQMKNISISHIYKMMPPTRLMKQRNGFQFLGK